MCMYLIWIINEGRSVYRHTVFYEILAFSSRYQDGQDIQQVEEIKIKTWNWGFCLKMLYCLYFQFRILPAPMTISVTRRKTLSNVTAGPVITCSLFELAPQVTKPAPFVPDNEVKEVVSVTWISQDASQSCAQPVLLTIVWNVPHLQFSPANCCCVAWWGGLIQRFTFCCCCPIE